MLKLTTYEQLLCLQPKLSPQPAPDDLAKIQELLLSPPAQPDYCFCQTRFYKNGILGSMRFPGIISGEPGYHFALFPNRVYLYQGNATHIERLTMILLEKNNQASYGTARFFLDLVLSHLENDLLALEELDNHIAKLEEGILSGKPNNFQHTMIHLKRRIRECTRYYGQLTEFGQCIAENEQGIFNDAEATLWDRYTQKTETLITAAKDLREYALMVQETYHSEIEIRQNNVMKMLTLITAIFLPLTLIAGWYGMNFKHMPELDWKYGYIFVIILSVSIVTWALTMFKKKNYW